jgi:two-component system sensor histidine kinase YesM
MLLSGDYISSVFIFDIYSNYYYSYKVGPIAVEKDKVYSTNWFKELKQNNGEPMFISKSEDIIQFITRPNHNYISLVREISDVDDYSPLATLLLTIDEKTIQKYFDEVGKQYNSQYCIVDSKGNYIIYPSNYDKKMDEYFLMEQGDQNGYEVCDINNQSMILARQDLNIHDWKLVGMLPISDNINLSDYYKSSILLIIGLNFVFVFVCSLVLTKLIFHPLNKVQKHMEMVEHGEFIEMPVNIEYTDEITQLKKVFNQMVRSIIDLIMQVKKEEKIIAQGELQLLQAQINPHFLYNTLDAVSALALIEDHENCLKMTQALGNFYRNSLNSGKDLVTVEDEQTCIESYMTILNIRYDNKVKLLWDLEDRIKKELILKLILQPIVENAVHHGIRYKVGLGTIKVKGYLEEEDIIFIVTDDGVGMSEERIKDIFEGKKTGKSGFGLYSSIQRIALFYDVKNPMTIHSEVGIGTEVVVRVKKI